MNQLKARVRHGEATNRNWWRVVWSPRRAMDRNDRCRGGARCICRYTLLKAEEAEVCAAVADHGIAGRSASSNFVDFENSVVTPWAAGLSASLSRDATV